MHQPRSFSTFGILTFLSLIALTFGCAKPGPDAVGPSEPKEVRGFVGPDWGNAGLRPPTPTNFIVKKISGSIVELNWDKIPDSANQPQAYRLYRSPGSGTQEVYQAFLPSELSFSDTGLTPDREYTYYLTAMNVNGESAAAIVKFTPSDKPSMPTGIMASIVSANEVKFEFNDTSEDELGFEIERRDSANHSTSLMLSIAAYGPTMGRRVFLDTSVKPESTYKYRVRSVGPGGANLGFTGFSAWVTPSNIPSVPTGLTAVAQSGTQVLVRWADTSYNATGFTVRRQLSNGTQTTTFETGQTSYLDSTAAPETNYRYSVRANNGSVASSAYTSHVYVATPTLDPPVPTNLQAEILAPNKVRLKWSRNGGPASETFEVQYRLAGQNYGSGNIASGLIDPQFDHFPVASGKTQYYRVRAIAQGNLGQSAYSSELKVVTPTGVPANPSNLRLLTATETSLALAWNGDATQYRIERRLVPGTQWSVAAEGVTALSFTDVNLAADKSYDYRVRGSNEFGDSVGYSDVLRATTLPLLPSAPTDLVLSSPVPGNFVNLYFRNNDGRSTLVGFHIFRRKSGDNWPAANQPTFTIAGPKPVGTVTFTDPSVVHNTTYYYRVKAVNAYGDSAYSNAPGILVNQQPPTPSITVRYRTVPGYSVVLRWNAIPLISNYEVQRRENNGAYQTIAIPSASAVEYSDTSVAEDKRYTYRLRSQFGTVFSGYSNEVTIMPDKVPSPPSGLQAVAVHAHDVQLRFKNESDNQFGFEIYRKVGNQETRLVGFNFDGPPDSQVDYTLTGLSSQTSYELIVKATNQWGDSTGISLNISTPAN